MNRSTGAEYTVYNILRLSVLLSLIVIAIGIAGRFYQLHAQGSLSSGGLVFSGVSIVDVARMIFSGDFVGLMGLSIIVLILGVVLSIATTLVISFRVRDGGLAVVSAMLLILMLISVFVGILVRSRS